MTNLLPCVEVNPSASPAASVIWLHGLGADGHDFEAIVPELRLPKSLPVRFVFPHAPNRSVTINGGAVMRAWYDVLDLDFPRQVDEQALEESVKQTQLLIRREMERGVPSKQIVVAGFSQGGVIALHAGLRFSHRLAGILALSTYLPDSCNLEKGRSAANHNLPIKMAHGTEDPVIPLIHGQQACEHLKQWGYPVRWSAFPMPHAVCAEEIQEIAIWLSTLLSHFMIA